MHSLIKHFAARPLLCNVTMFGTIIVAIYIWQRIGKEEMPEFAREAIRITLRYPGAASGDVEQLVTKPVEERLRAVSGIKEVRSTAGFGTSSLRVEFATGTKDLPGKIQEVRDAISRAKLPDEVDEAEIRQFNTAEKAILDVAIFHKEHRSLDDKSREQLQKFALAFQSRVLTLSKVSGVNISGYRNPEIRIEVDPKKLKTFELTMSEVRRKIRDQHIRLPVGSIQDEDESSVTILSELDTVQGLENVILRSGFSGKTIRLKQIATVTKTFQKQASIRKVQGHEGIIFNIKKSLTADILSTQEVLVAFIKNFQETFKDSPIAIVMMDDESYDVRNRIQLIANNGVIGFILIVIVLFIFLDLKTGLWVGMGIPFSLAFTLIASAVLGYTVNNMTLCAVIIVIGIVVDDAIIVAENIDRKILNGQPPEEASLSGTYEVIRAILAAILTTCVAFIPLYFFKARYGALLKYIPLIIFLMLTASLVESAFILPSHLRGRKSLTGKGLGNIRKHALAKVEHYYEKFTFQVLRWRLLVIIAFVGTLIGAGLLFRAEMKFVMFPREESTSIALKVVAAEGTKKLAMAKLIEPLEDMFVHDKIVTAVRTNIGVSRRGGAVKEHEASMFVEILPPSEREITLRMALKQWKAKTQAFDQFEEIKFRKSRWGRDSGSPIEIQVRGNNDQDRRHVVEQLRSAMSAKTYLANVEIERPRTKPEFRLTVRDDITNRLGVSAAELSASLRSHLEGTVLYTITNGEEEVDVRLSSSDESKHDIKSLLQLGASNRENYLIPIAKLVKVTETRKPVNIKRDNFKRTTDIFADIAEGKPGEEITPLEIAERLEASVFPQILAKTPSVDLVFKGEIEDSRESRSDFGASVIMIVALIYIILVFLYNSLVIPIVIGSIIPFGIIGVIVAFYAHGMTNFGFFAVIGTLGMIGVVVNDAIVMVAKLEEELSCQDHQKGHWRQVIAQISTTRLRPVVLTSITTVAGLFPTAYGLAGYDSMLAEMMMAMGWGLIFSTVITLIFLPCIYSYFAQVRSVWRLRSAKA